MFFSEGDKSSNKHLAIASTDPTKTGDVFYTCSALFMLAKSFGINTSKDLECSSVFKTSASAASVSCRHCDNELGLWDEKHQLFQLWHHALTVSQEQCSSQEQHQEVERHVKSTVPCETFRRMIVGIVQESLGQSVKIYFSSKMTRQRLFVWVIEPNLCLLSASSSGSDCQLLQSKKVMKVLFQVTLQFTLIITMGI